MHPREESHCTVKQVMGPASGTAVRSGPGLFLFALGPGPRRFDPHVDYCTCVRHVLGMREPVT